MKEKITTKMRDRIWRDLRNSRFYLEYLGLHIQAAKKKNKNIETLLLLSALGSIGGWYKFAEFSILWSVILLLITGIRILKSRFTVSEEEIATWQNVYNFYIDHYKELENLWYKYENNRINETQAEKIYDTFNTEERLMIKINKHSKIYPKEPIASKAEEFTVKYLKQFE